MKDIDIQTGSCIEGYLKGISNNHSRQNVQGASTTGQTQTAEKPGVVVHFSDQTKALNTVRKAVESLPEIRLEKVEQLRQAITENRYVIDSNNIAAKIIHHFI